MPIVYLAHLEDIVPSLSFGSFVVARPRDVYYFIFHNVFIVNFVTPFYAFIMIQNYGNSKHFFSTLAINALHTKYLDIIFTLPCSACAAFRLLCNTTEVSSNLYSAQCKKNPR